MTNHPLEELDDDSHHVFNDLFLSGQFLKLHGDSLDEFLALYELKREKVADT